MIEWILKILDWIWNKIRKKSEIVEIIQLYEARLKEKEKFYEEKIKEKEREIQRLEQEKKTTIQRLKKEKYKKEREIAQIVQSIERNKILKEKLIEKFDKPLNVIFLSYSTQKIKKNGKFITYPFIKEELKKYNAKWLGGTDFIIPPSENITKQIKTRSELEKWFENEILKGRFCRIKFLGIVDLRKVIWKNFVTPSSKRQKFHYTLGEVLNLRDIFTEDEIEKLSLKEIIMEGDIGWLASSCLPEKEIKRIYENQREIERELGNPSLRILAKEDQILKLKEVLEKYGIKNSEEVAKCIVKEAQFWYDKLA